MDDVYPHYTLPTLRPTPGLRKGTGPRCSLVQRASGQGPSGGVTGPLVTGGFRGSLPRASTAHLGRYVAGVTALAAISRDHPGPSEPWTGFNAGGQNSGGATPARVPGGHGHTQGRDRREVAAGQKACVVS